MRIARHNFHQRQRRSLWQMTQDRKSYMPLNSRTVLRIVKATEGGALGATHQTLPDCDIEKLVLGTIINTVRTVTATEA